MNSSIKLILLTFFLTCAQGFSRDIVIFPGADPGEAIAAARPGDVVIFEDGDHKIGGRGVIVEGKTGITILGEFGKLLQSDPEGIVMTLRDCKDVTLRDLYMAHDPEVTKELCLGGVLEIESSSGIIVDNCHLDGCGAWAITATDVSGLDVRKIKATHNSAGVFWFFDSENVSVTGSLVAGNYESEEATGPLPVLYASKTDGLIFVENTVKDNRNRIFEQIEGSTDVVIKDNRISGNAFETETAGADPAPAPHPQDPSPKPKPGPMRDPDGLLATVEKAYADGKYDEAAKMAMTALALDPKCEGDVTPEFFAISASSMLARAREVERADDPEIGAVRPPEAADYYRYSAFFNRALATGLLVQMADSDDYDFETLYGELLEDYAPLPAWVQLSE
ncbi:MAG: hypothetical protein ACI8UO_006220 [Verrucomicrobiales bacterium]|jgi:hypothetical protein